MFIIREIIWYVSYFFLFKIKKYKNIHKGQTVYILADSAEIKLYNLKLFDNHPMICFNRSHLLNDIIIRHSVTYNLFGEPFHFYKFRHKKNVEEMLYVKNHLRKSKNISFVHLSNFFSLFSSRVCFFFNHFPGDKYTKTNTKTNIKNFQRTDATAISFAIYMGFSKIILVGFSVHSYSVDNHWFHYGLGNKSDWSENSWKNNRNHAGMNLDNIEKFVDICAVVPYENAQSPFKLITYEALFNDKIKYAEYDQLVSESYVQILTKFDYHF